MHEKKNIHWKYLWISKQEGGYDDDYYDDDDNGKMDLNAIPKTAHEITDFVIEKPNFEILPTTELVFIGNIYEILENVIVVQSMSEAAFVLDSESLFTYEDREIMGEVKNLRCPILNHHVDGGKF